AILNSAVTIQADGNFDSLFCSAGSALLGQAGPNSVHRDFVGAPLATTWYGADLNPGVADIGAAFNSNIDAGCFSGAPNGWYYGFDGVVPAGKIDIMP